MRIGYSKCNMIALYILKCDGRATEYPQDMLNETAECDSNYFPKFLVKTIFGLRKIVSHDFSQTTKKDFFEVVFIVIGIGANGIRFSVWEKD